MSRLTLKFCPRPPHIHPPPHLPPPPSSNLPHIHLPHNHPIHIYPSFTLKHSEDILKSITIFCIVFSYIRDKGLELLEQGYQIVPFLCENLFTHLLSIIA